MRRREMTVCALICLLATGTATAAPDDPAGRIDRLMAEAFDPAAPGAAVIVAHQGKTVLRAGYGLADLELGVPVEPEMVFRIGSITKTFTAAAILLLEDRGLLALTDPVAAHLPDAPAACRPVTIEQLLSHTGGVPDIFDDAFYQLLATRAHDLLNDEVAAAAFVDLLRGRDLDFEPGSRFSYSNGGYFLLGRIIEAVSSLDYDAFVRSSISRPLGLDSTCYLDPLAVRPGRVRAYLDDEGGYLNNPYAPLAGVYLDAAGALESSVDDLLGFARSLQSDALLPATSMGCLFESRTRDLLPESQQYGLGSWVGRLQGRRMVWHGGDAHGFSGTMVSLPDDGIYVVILTGNPYLASRDLDVLARQAAAILLDDPIPPRVRVRLSSEQLAELVGVYQVADGPRRELSVQDGRVFMQRDGGRKTEVFPATPTRLFLEHTVSYVTFERNPAGRIERLVLNRFSGEKETAARVR